MFCIHCGAPNPEGASFCSTCGKAIGASANLPAPIETHQYVVGSAEQSPRTAVAQISPPISLTAQPPAPYPPVPQGKGKPVLWILCGFAACLLIVVAVAVGSRLNQPSPAASAPPAVATSDVPSPTAPPTYAAPPAAPSTDNVPAPASVPAQPPPPPAAPQNSIIGDWRATTVIGSSIVLHFGADGRYTLTDVLDSEQGVYVFSNGDGTLRLQPNAVFTHNIVIWNCQLAGDSLSCVDPKGAGHVYSRFQP